MALGFLSLIESSNSNFRLAAILIFIAAIFDALDGLSARLTGTSNRFGVELDSLADIVSFGVAPSYLLYQHSFNQYGNYGILLSLLPMFAGGFRLARFNTNLQGFDKKAFSGLPIPSAAMTLASFIITFSQDGIISKFNESFLIVLVIIISWLMVSNIRYPKLPSFNKRGFREEPAFFILSLIAVILLIVIGLKVLFYVFVLVVLFGIFNHIYNFFFKKRN